MHYPSVDEKWANHYSAYVSDLQGCVATGTTIEESEREIREAIEFHIEGMIEDVLSVPQLTSVFQYVVITR
jgi:predicted RNase H-like HicB family nuclease